MLRTLKLFVDLCLLRANPQDLPHSVALELLALLVYTTLSYVLALSSTKPGTALLAALAALVDVAMLVGLAYAGLWILDLKSRLTKLVTASASSVITGKATSCQTAPLPANAVTSLVRRLFRSRIHNPA